MGRKRSWPPSREQIEERRSFQKWILLNGNLKALLRQELFNFLQGAPFIVNLHSDLAYEVPMLVPNSGQDVSFTFLDVDFQ